MQQLLQSGRRNTLGLQIRDKDDEHVNHLDIRFATDVDRFDFAMEVERENNQLRLVQRR